MGRDTLSCLEKRDLLNHSVVSVDTLLAWGERYEQSGFINDAVDFYEKAKAQDALTRLLARVIGEGDVFLFNRITRAMGNEVEPDEWLSLAKTAEDCGKFSFAAEAYRKSGQEEEALRCADRAYL